ncbi:hypothetical protein GW17_00019534 [Ensete ventricosum]|nr:hypothetical protein GW17_00019534 [Ensete ventricosum]
MRTACYRAVPPRSTVDGRLREKSTVSGRLREKKERKRGKEERRRRGEEERSTSFPRAVFARVPPSPSPAGDFSPAQGDGMSPCARRKIEATLISKVRHLVSYRHIELNSVCLEDVAEALCSCFFSLHGEKKRRFLLPAIAEVYTDVSSPYVGRRNVVFFSPRSPKLILPTKPRRGSSPVGDRLGSSRESGAGSSGSPFSSPSADTA